MGSKTSPINIDDNSRKEQQGNEGKKTCAGEQKATKTPARGRSQDKKGNRSRSVPVKEGAKKGGRRGGSVDSSVSSRRNNANSSDSESSKSKRKSDSNQGAQEGKTPKKTAKFKDDVRDNTGKTASTKKQVREKKLGEKKKDSYASKVEKEIKKN
jgi:hypothetical protein